MKYSNHKDDSTDTDQDVLTSPVCQRQANDITSPWLGETSNSEFGYSSECDESNASSSENAKDDSCPPSYILNPESSAGNKSWYFL